MVNAYSVINVRGCRVIDRPIPVGDIAALMAAWADNPDNAADPWVCEFLLAKHLGCYMVCGPRSLVFAWRKEAGIHDSDDNYNGIKR